MKKMKKNMRVAMIVFCAMFLVLAFYFVYAVNVYGGRWFSNPYNRRLEAQKSKVVAGSILDRNGKVLAETNSDGERVYAKDKETRLAVSHVVGDSTGLTSSGAENFMASYLLGFNNNVLERIYQQISQNSDHGSDVKLSIDGELSKYVSNAMGNYDGAVVVLNYETGEILAMVSHPMYDPNTLSAENVSKQGTALVNRATMGRYTPGSVYKIMTTTAAIRYIPDYDSRTWPCDGPLAFDAKTRKFKPDVHITPEEDKQMREEAKKTPKLTPKPTESGVQDEAMDGEEQEIGGLYSDYVILRNYESSYFGEIDLESAFARSCNNTMARIALEVGQDKMGKVAKAFSFDTDFMFNDLILYDSRYPKGETEYDLAWSSVGQYKDLVTPLHMAMIAGSIGNDGQMMEPKLLRSVINSRNYSTMMLKPKTFSQPLSKAEADQLTEYMRACVAGGTGRSAGIKGVEVCGKTGTAEVSSNKSVGNHAWFVGFIDGQDHPLAVAVVLEHAGSGGGKAAPVAGKVLKKAIDLGY